MTSSLLNLMLVVTTAIFLATLLPPCLLRHRYETKLKKINDDHQEPSSCPSQFTSLYLANLDPTLSEEMLIQIFSGFGKIIKLALAKDFRGESRGFAFMEFENADNIELAMTHMNGRLIGQKILYVERTPKVQEGQDK